jgi:enamine deaminase RidA (YjgF/YER057c/UK114 family)
VTRWRAGVICFASVLLAGRAQAQSFCRVNPATLPYSAGYAQLVVHPDRRTVTISGQVAQDSSGAILGVDDPARQVSAVFDNLQRALAAVGADFGDIMKWNIYSTRDTVLPLVRAERVRRLAGQAPPASTYTQVVQLFRPDVMVEIDATAYAPTPLSCRQLRSLERKAEPTR